MKASAFVVAALTSVAAASVKLATASSSAAPTKAQYGGSYPSSYSNCPFLPSPSHFVLFADNIQTVSQANPNQAFLRSQDLYVESPGDLGTASSFTVPDFALGAQCSINLAVPSANQIGGDLSQVTFSGGGNLNFSRLLTNLPSSGLTFNTLGGLQNNGVMKVTPGKLLTLAQFPCPPPGTQLPGIITSVDTFLVLRDTVGPVCPSGLIVIIEPVGNPPVSPPPASAPAGPSPIKTATSYSYSTWSSAATYSFIPSYCSAPTYTSTWHA